MAITLFFRKQAAFLRFILGLVVVLSIGVVDRLTGPEISFSIFYLIPIVWGTWFASGSVGVLLSIASAVAWLSADLLAGRTYSHWLIPYWNALVRLGFFLTSSITLSMLRRTLGRERALARADSLTGAANGRWFAESARREVSRSNRYVHPFTVIYIDLDNFKAVNDRFGHSEGDALLQTIASLIQPNIRAVDLLGRLGGDEFAVLLPETGYEQSQVVADKIQGVLHDGMQQNGWPVTFSIGVATFATPPTSVDEMIRVADDLMYSVKRAGKNGIRHEVFGNQMEDTAMVAKHAAGEHAPPGRSTTG